MSWKDILKLARTNTLTSEKYGGSQSFLLNDDIWAQAGGRKWDNRHLAPVRNQTGEGDRFMDIEDVEEAIGRRLTADDFQIYGLNWLTENQTVLDRVGEGREKLAEEDIAGLIQAILAGGLFVDANKYLRGFVDLFPNNPLTYTINRDKRLLG